MFEKEAKEYATDCEKEFQTSYGACLQSFNDGADFGYHKAKEELIALINAERERQEKCDDIHLRTIAELDKENAELKEKLAGAERTSDNLRQLGFPTFQSCKEYAEHIAELKEDNMVMADNYSEMEQKFYTKLSYAKTIIKDLLDNSDEYARQRAIDFLKEE